MEQLYTAPAVPVKPDGEERRQIRKRYNKAALVIFINMMIFNVFCYGGSLVIHVLGQDKLFENEVFSALYSFGVPILSEVISIIIGIKMFGLDLKSKFTRDGFTGSTVLKLIFLGIGLMTAGAILGTIIATILENFGYVTPVLPLEPRKSAAVSGFMYFYACLLGPVLEELLYRGVLLQSMRKYNERFAIFLSALIFGLMHQNYQQFIYAFLLGIPLAIVTIKYESLLPAIFTHIAANTSSTFFTCWLEYTAPDFFQSAASGNTDLHFTAGGTAAFLCTLGFRVAAMIAGLVIGIISLVKGKNMSRPTPAGKARTMPIFVTSVLWWVVIILYIFLCFVLPFMVS